MNQRRSTLFLGNTLALALSAGLPSHAQEPVPQQTPAEAATADNEQVSDEVVTTDTVVVTGSRIIRPELDAPNPVQAFDAERIERSGETNITEFLRDTPALGSSSTSADTAGNTYGSPASVGLNLLNLRDLGAARTLTLVNGRRHVASVPGEAGVDVGSIPTALIERVDVLTGGVSAIYGADGVSGVVNFVLKRDFEGVAVDIQTGMSSRNDAATQDASFLFGKNFADMRGNIAIAYQYTQSDALSEKDRSFTGDPLKTWSVGTNPDDPLDQDPNAWDNLLFNDVRYHGSSPNGALDVDFDGIADYQGNGQRYDNGRVLGEGETQGGSGTPLAGFNGFLTPKERQHNVNLLASFDASPALRLFAEGKYVDGSTYSQAQPSYDADTILAPDNAFLNQRLGARAPDGALMYRDNLDLGYNEDFVDRKLWRGVIGAEGDLSDHLRYELSYTYGRSDSFLLKTRNRLTDRYYAALDAVVDPATGRIVCRSDLFPGQNIDPENYDAPAVTFTPGPGSGCIPYNPLGEGVADPAASQWFFAHNQMDARVTQQVLSGSVSGDLGNWFELPGGPMGFALGAEYRKEASVMTPSADLQQDQVLDIGPYAITQGEFDVREVFGEIAIPVLKDARFAKTLSFGAAVRFSDYSTIGNTTAWKVDGVYAPIEDISLRATLSQVVRAPNISELFSGPISSFGSSDDPCDPTNLQSGSSFRADNCVALLRQLGLNEEQIAGFSPNRHPSAALLKPELTSGNPNLSEESARTWTAGVVFRPRFLQGFTASLDWYDIELQDAINTAGGGEMARLCVDQPSLDNTFCDAVVRDPETGFITEYFVRPENVAAFRTSGMDLSLNYRFTPNAGIGTFEIDLVGNYLRRLEFIATPGAEVSDRVNYSAPRRMANLDVSWEREGLTLGYGLDWQGRTDNYTPEETAEHPDIGPDYVRYTRPRMEHRAHIAYDFGDGFNVFGGVNNLTDQKPGYVSWGGVTPVGRYIYFGVGVEFH